MGLGLRVGVRVGVRAGVGVGVRVRVGFGVSRLGMRGGVDLVDVLDQRQHLAWLGLGLGLGLG